MADKEFGAGVITLLNAAAAGWGTADYVAFVNEVGEQIKPDAVLVFISTDDIGRSLRSNLAAVANPECNSIRWTPKPNYMLKTIMNQIPLYQYIIEHSHLSQLIRNVTANIIVRRSLVRCKEEQAKEPCSAPVNDIQVPRNLGMALFANLKAWCDNHGARLIITTTGRHVSPAGNLAMEPTRVFMSVAPRYFADIEVPFYDFSDVYFALPEADRMNFTISGDGHPSPAGARFIADSTWRPFLRDQFKKLVEKQGNGKSETSQKGR